MSGIRALGAAVQMPCVGAMLPDIVPTDMLSRVNGLNSSLQSIIMIASPLAGGALLSMASLETVFFVDVVTAIIGISLLLLFLRLPAREKPEGRKKAAT